MVITECKVMIPRPSPGRVPDQLLAFVEVVLDGVIKIHDIKIIMGSKGPFISMPSRPVTIRCPSCHHKVRVKDRYCGFCRVGVGDDNQRMFSDIVHPITASCRQAFERAIMTEYEAVKSLPV